MTGPRISMMDKPGYGASGLDEHVSLWQCKYCRNRAMPVMFGSTDVNTVIKLW
jgi:hypothetical protein